MKRTFTILTVATILAATTSVADTVRPMARPNMLIFENEYGRAIVTKRPDGPLKLAETFATATGTYSASGIVTGITVREIPDSTHLQGAYSYTFVTDEGDESVADEDIVFVSASEGDKVALQLLGAPGELLLTSSYFQAVVE